MPFIIVKLLLTWVPYFTLQKTQVQKLTHLFSAEKQCSEMQKYILWTDLTITKSHKCYGIWIWNTLHTQNLKDIAIKLA